MPAKGRTIPFLSSGPAARILGVSVTTLHRMVQRGDLLCTDSTNGRMFDQAVVRALAAERKRAAELVEKA